MTRIPPSTVSSSWGTRSQLGATMDALRDLQGNKDGLHKNEDKPAGTIPDAIDRNPLAAKAKAALSVGVSTKDEQKVLASFVSDVEAKSGRPVVNEKTLSMMKSGPLFAAQKAIALMRIGVDPTTVKDHFVAAKGSVDGRAIAPRNIFTQEFPPVGEPSGKVVVVSPGFQETGRNFYAQIDEMTQKGHRVVVMDHQWAGQSDGSAGGIDSGFGVARDVAAVAAYAATVAKENHGEKGEVVLFGNSMGGGPGVIGALALNAAGKIDLDGAPMPQGMNAVVQSPFLGATPSLLNDTLQAAAKLPFLNRLKAPAAGLPDLTDDKTAEAKGAQGAVMEDVRAQLSAFGSVKSDIESILSLVASNPSLLSGRLGIVHGRHDTLADPAGSEKLAGLLGDNATLKFLDTKNHVLEESPLELGHAVEMLEVVIEDEE